MRRFEHGWRGGLVAAMLTLALIGPAKALGSDAAMHHRALWTWWWHSPQRMASYAKANGFDRVYLESEGVFGKRVTATIRDLRARGIAVEALGGEDGWALHPAGMLSFINATRAYQRSAPAGRRLAGIHVDVEPYGLRSWSNHRARTKAGFLRSLAKAHRAAGPLPLTADVPFWFDAVSARSGSSTSMATAVIRRTDATTIMAYRDTASGVFDAARAEVKLAAAQGKRAAVGVETNPVHPSSVSFHDRGRAALDRALAKLSMRFAPKPGFGGLAVEDFHGLKSLGP
jgi:hypothetical protein